MSNAPLISPRFCAARRHQRALFIYADRLTTFTMVASALLAAHCSTRTAAAHGTLVNDRMYQVRVAVRTAATPAVWNDSFYTWNQNSHNFPHCASPSFSYAATVPDGTIAHAGINDGVQTALDFTGLNTPSANWGASAANAGQPFGLHWVATAPHDPSFFQVYITRRGSM
jgi:predicted carbohydrate-binding protein with CBM5 and CBM33 domain